jgi:hypothetical protein
MVSYRKITLRHNPEDVDLNLHRRENLKQSYLILQKSLEILSCFCAGVANWNWIYTQTTSVVLIPWKI